MPLQKYIRSHFKKFYEDIYNSLPDFEPADSLTNKDIEKLIGIINSMELRYQKIGYQYVVAGVIVHTAMDHLLVNGNKRLSLFIGYFCAFWYGHLMILPQGNFKRLIKQIVIEIGKEDDRVAKNRKRLNYIKALANEIEEYSAPRNQQKIDCTPVVAFVKKFIK